MENNTTVLPSPPSNKLPNVSRITVIIAIVLFLIGLGIYISSSDNFQTGTPIRETIVPTQLVSSTPRPERVEGQVIIKFKNGITDAQINERLRPLNASIKSKVKGINTTVITVPPGQEDAILKELADDPIVQYAEPDYIYYLQLTPNDPDFGLQWSLMNTGQTVNNRRGTVDADIDAEIAWDVSRGTGVKVAILDSGIDANHPEFASKIVGTRIFSTASIADKNGHGTHVAGILAANTNNGQGVAGVCPDCQLLIGKITNDDAAGSVPTSAIAPSITWAADSGAQVINMSIAGPNFSQSVQDAVNYAWGKNAVIVAAAGNDGSTAKRYPAAYANVVSVGNSNSVDAKTSTSNYGSWVFLAAPGDTIRSTLPTTPNLRNTTNYGYMSGTSMASPAVAGVAALVWKTQYGTSNTAVVQRLYTTADKIAGTGTTWVHGRLNAANAVGLSPTAGPTTITPSRPTVIPSFVCGGSTNNVCEPTATVTVTQNPGNPSGTPGTSTAPTGTTVNPSITPPFNPGTNPRLPGNHHKRNEGAVGKFIAFLLALFAALVNFILSMFGNR